MANQNFKILMAKILAHQLMADKEVVAAIKARQMNKEQVFKNQQEMNNKELAMLKIKKLVKQARKKKVMDRIEEVKRMFPGNK